MTLPTRQEINPHDDLDGRAAAKHFFGKSLEEAEALFRESPDYYREDLLWMGPAAFRYYVDAAIRFIRSNAVTGESDFIAGLASTLELRLDQEPAEMAPVAVPLADVCREIVEQWPRFELGSEAYGDVRARYRTLHEAFSRLVAERHT
jgi:hypothetical protein